MQVRISEYRSNSVELKAVLVWLAASTLGFPSSWAPWGIPPKIPFFAVEYSHRLHLCRRPRVPNGLMGWVPAKRTEGSLLLGGKDCLQVSWRRHIAGALSFHDSVCRGALGNTHNYKDGIYQDFVMSVFPWLISRQSHKSAKGHKACKWQRQDSTRLSGSHKCSSLWDVCVWVVWQLFGELFSWNGPILSSWIFPHCACYWILV